MGFPVTVVLGASGRIGTLLRHCWPQLYSSPEIASALRWQSRRPLPPSLLPVTTAEHIALLDPLTDPKGLAALISGADQVLCLAGAIPGRGGDLADNARLACATVQAAARAAETSGRPAPRVLLSSSAAIYGNQPGVLAEDCAPNPANAYGQAKLEMEQQAQALGAELGVPVTALRIGNIAGLDAILGGWQPGFCLDQFADGRSPRRSYIGPRSLAEILARLLCTPDLPAALNLAQPGLVEMADLLRAAALPFDRCPAPATAIAEVALDLQLLMRILGQIPQADAAQMQAEWSMIEPVFAKKPAGPKDPIQSKEPRS
ncbi:NAD(P)-dependent oxidoreductase [Pseudophaeobacter sp.]|uniref:NAD-dependent epimerase/dehydratase family protein n=1 Tax=Pseudophaeobacter sp. TaxID=1971739 RepID=UPI003296E054